MNKKQLFINAALIKRFKEVGNQSESADPIVVMRLFHPILQWDFLCTTYYPKTKICDGFARTPDREEWGSIGLDHEKLSQMGMEAVEIDTSFLEDQMSEVPPPNVQPGPIDDSSFWGFRKRSEAGGTT